MVKVIVFLLLIAVLLGAGFSFFPQKSDFSGAGRIVEMMGKTVSKDVSIKAKFAIYTLGTKRIFTDSRYHNLSPFVYLQKDAPDTIFVKKNGITWGDFFDTLPMKVSNDCLTTGTGQMFCSGVDGSLRFYINQVEDEDALTKEIKDGDIFLIEYEQK